MDVASQVLAAETRIRPYIRQTFLEHSAVLSRQGANVHLKLENLQHTGAFKVRGALNRLLSLSAEQREGGIVTASTGNHGAAVAFSLKTVDARGIVFVPETAAAGKLATIEQLGVEIRRAGSDCVQTETTARRYADKHGMIYVPPYNDELVVAGQGTIGVELVRQLDRIDTVFAAVGGGGLISGIAGYLKSINPAIEIVGCSPENSQVMIQSVRAGRILDLPSISTLSDSTAGGVESGSITFELCRNLVDRFETVSEEEIAAGIRQILAAHHQVIEGAAAVAVAASARNPERYRDKNVVVIICGGNITPETLKSVL